MKVSLPGRRVGTVVILVFASVATLGTPALAHLPAISVPCGEVKALREAIEAANNSTTHPGDDTISLAAGCTYTVTDEYAAAGHGFPFITSTIRLLGNGATITRAAAAPILRFFNIEASGFLLIDRLTLDNGYGPGALAGAIYDRGDLSVTNSTFEDNTQGAVVVGVNAGASFIDTVFRNNRFNSGAGGDGGAVTNSGLAYFERATLVDNAAPAGVGITASGGALYNGPAGEMTIYRSTVTDNFTNRSGGAVANGGDLLIIDSTLDHNRSGWGGAVSSWGDSILTISNSTLADNRASISTFDAGGALHLEGPVSVSLTHTTIAGNSANRGVGGILDEDGTASITMTKSILSNTGGNCRATITDGGYNIGYPASSACPATFATGSPALLALADHGGLTRTMTLGAVSSARDQIPASGAGCPAKDQRGFSRPFGSACDIGAVESQPPTAPGSFAASPSPNQGSFQLTWTAATDPDRDLMSYVIESMDADDATWVFSRQLCCFTSTGWSTPPEREGRITYRIRATDGAYTSAWVTSGQVVIDRTDPDVPSAAPDAAPEYTDGGGNRWFADDVTISFTPGSDPALPDGSAGSGIISTTAPQTFLTEGPFSATGNSTDAAGNVSADRVYAGNVDTGAPSVAFTSCPSSVILGSSQSIGWTASDTGSGVNGATSGSVALDTSAIGPHTAVTPTVADNVGHNATDTCDYDVIWDFAGFRAPLKPFPTLANVGSGQQVRVTFSLGGDQGLAVIESGYPVSAAIDCASTAPLESGDPAVAAGPLTYSSQTGDYSYQWVTSKAWKGTCRQFILKLDDGTYHRANLRFK